MVNYDRDELKKIRNAYPVGTRIELVKTTDIYTKLDPGTLGTVTGVDDMGTIHMHWDNGSCLGMILGEDNFTKV